MEILVGALAMVATTQSRGSHKYTITVRWSGLSMLTNQGDKVGRL